MSLAAPPQREGEQTVDGTLRLRGGCIPCPVRLFPRIRLPTTSRVDQGRAAHCSCVDEDDGALFSPTIISGFDPGCALTNLLVKCVGRLEVLHHTYSMLLLIERVNKPQFTISPMIRP